MLRIALAVAGVGLATALTACGGGDDFADGSADDIVESAKSDMGDLKAVKVAGTVTTDGQEISLDIQANADGDCTGSIGVADGSVELLGVGGETWMKPDEAFWRTSSGGAADEMIGIVGDKWVVVPDDEDSLNDFCDVDDLLDQLLKDEDDGSTYSKNGTDEVDGDDVVKIDNEDPDEGTSTGYVLVDAPHYLVKIDKTDGADTGSVTFSEFDEVFEVTAPSTDEVVDLDSLSS
jgi:hypothetical protein